MKSFLHIFFQESRYFNIKCIYITTLTINITNSIDNSNKHKKTHAQTKSTAHGVPSSRHVYDHNCLENVKKPKPITHYSVAKCVTSLEFPSTQERPYGYGQSGPVYQRNRRYLRDRVFLSQLARSNINRLQPNITARSQISKEQYLSIIISEVLKGIGI